MWARRALLATLLAALAHAGIDAAAVQPARVIGNPPASLAVDALAAELARDRIAAVAVNPGGVASDIWRTFSPAVMLCFRPLQRLLFLNTEQGAATSVAAATAVEPGGRRLPPGDALYLPPEQRVRIW